MKEPSGRSWTTTFVVTLACSELMGFFVGTPFTAREFLKMVEYSAVFATVVWLIAMARWHRQGFEGVTGMSSQIDVFALVSDFPVGTWLAVAPDESEILATGTDWDTAEAGARAKGETHPILIRVPDPAVRWAY